MLGPMFSPITDDMRDQAMIKARDILSRLDTIRRELGIPEEDLGLVAETYVGILQSIANEAQEAEWQKRQAEVGQYAMVGSHFPHNLMGVGPSPFDEIQKLRADVEMWSAKERGYSGD